MEGRIRIKKVAKAKTCARASYDALAVLDALLNIGDARAVETLIATLKDDYFMLYGFPEHKEIRRAAAKALERITGQDFGMNADSWQEWWEKQQ